MSQMARKSAPHWLFLHGTPLSPAVWTEVASNLPGLVWAPHITPTPGIANPQRQLAASVIHQARRTGGERWRVVGHSFGGQVALEIALIAPDLVEQLIIVCSRDTPFPPFAAAADGLEAGAPIDTDAALHRWFRPAEITARPAFMNDIAAQLMRADRRSWATALRGIAAFDAVPATSSIAVPATVIAAEYDSVGTPVAMREMAQRLAVAEFSIIPDASHMSLFLYPARFAAAITADSR